MWHVIAFNTLFLICCPYALWRGGAPERLAAAMEVVAVVSTAMVQALFRTNRYYVDFSLGIFLIDSAFMVALCGIALTADRFWPMAAAAFQVADIIVHLSKFVVPDIASLGYAVGITAWGYPKVILFAIDTRRHQQRLVRYGLDPSWSRARPMRNVRISARNR